MHIAISSRKVGVICTLEYSAHIKRRADQNLLFGVIKPYVTWVWLSLEVSVKQTLKSLAVTGFVAVASRKHGVKRLQQRLVAYGFGSFVGFHM